MDVQTRVLFFFRWRLASSGGANMFLSLEYSVKAVTPDQLVSSLVGFLLSVQEKLVLKSALTRKDWIVFEVNFGRYQRHVAYLQHIRFRQLIREFPFCWAD